MTEMLYAVADIATIVARCPQDNFPAAALHKPVVNNYPLDLERLVTTKPDVVFTVEGITSVDDAQRLQELGIPVYYVRFGKVEDVFEGRETLDRLERAAVPHGRAGYQLGGTGFHAERFEPAAAAAAGRGAGRCAGLAGGGAALAAGGAGGRPHRGLVALCGPVGFVGLLVPHLTRRLLGTTGRVNLLFCAVLGGGFLLACDLLARLLYPPAGLPVGLVTALFGVPFFVYLLRKTS